ncbi:MAG: hypothetical protein BWY75_03699 [bacterium ADurb.Bin425]|nr:MAG: hypothetical protein BWY75_03699 [bacterium ADurb.Bin425]
MGVFTKQPFVQLVKRKLEFSVIIDQHCRSGKLAVHRTGLPVLARVAIVIDQYGQVGAIVFNAGKIMQKFYQCAITGSGKVYRLPFLRLAFITFLLI